MKQAGPDDIDNDPYWGAPPTPEEQRVTEALKHALQESPFGGILDERDLTKEKSP